MHNRRAAIALAAGLFIATVAAVAIVNPTADARPQAASDIAEPQGVIPHYLFDLNNDECTDIPFNYLGNVNYYPGVCPNGGFSGDAFSTGLFQPQRPPLFAVGDWDNNGCSDVGFLLGENNDRFRVVLMDCAGGALGNSELGTGWSDYNFIVAPGSFDFDNCADIIARRKSDNALVLFSGNCGADPAVDAPVDIGIGWGVFDWIGGAGDWDGDSCADLLARRSDDTTLWVYPGTCAAGFGAPQSLGFGWNNFSQIFGGGNWDHIAEGALACPDILGILPDNNGNTVRLYSSDCQGGFFSQNVDVLGGFGPAYHWFGNSGPFRGDWTWGDVDCDGDIDPVDGLKLLRQDAGLSVTQVLDCLRLPDVTTINGADHKWGDVDCDNDVDPVDALKVLRFDGGLPVPPPANCPAINTNVLLG